MLKFALLAKAAKKGGSRDCGCDDVIAYAILAFIAILAIVFLGVAPVRFIIGATKIATNPILSDNLMGEGALSVFLNHFIGIPLLFLGVKEIIAPAPFSQNYFRNDSEEAEYNSRLKKSTKWWYMAVIAIILSYAVLIAMTVVAIRTPSAQIESTLFVIIGALSLVNIALGGIAKLLIL